MVNTYYYIILPMTIKSELGALGEDLACNYLQDKGYKILDRNYRKSWGEIDIIARAPDRTLVFVEVKTLRSYSGQTMDQLKPEDELTQAKLGKLQRTAQLYAGHYPEKVDDRKGWRIDLLAITMSADEEPRVVRYENI